MKRQLMLLILLAATTLTLSAQKLTADEIIAKHLEAIGSAADRDLNKNTSIVGDVLFEIGSSKLYSANGRAVFANEGNKLLFAMTFPVVNYPMEKVIFDGKTPYVAFANEGTRSELGQFLFTNNGIIREGLLGGVFSKGWVLATAADRNSRVTAEGSKKIDGRDTWVLSIEPKKPVGLRVKVFIDKENFRHVRTEYFRTLSAAIGKTPETSSKQSEAYESLIEDYSDFKVENGLSLPRGYKISLYLQRDNLLKEVRYTYKFKDYYYNQKLDPATFAIGNN